MIRPPAMRGAAFGRGADGNGRDDGAARRAISAELGLPDAWATLRQVHGAEVLRAAEPGPAGAGDALLTEVPMMPLCVATADCFPVVIEADGAVGIAHAGWRGTAADVVGALRRALEAVGAAPLRAAIGPGIGPCCFEVGDEVAGLFPEFESTTTWGARSVDLPAALGRQLGGLEVAASGVCTRCDEGYHSFRRNETDERQVALAWLLPG